MGVQKALHFGGRGVVCGEGCSVHPHGPSTCTGPLSPTPTLQNRHPEHRGLRRQVRRGLGKSTGLPVTTQPL